VVLKISKKDHASVYDIWEIVLIALFAVNAVLNEETNIDYFFYLKIEDSIKYLIEKALNCNLQQDQFMKSMFILDYAKLIYRFTCAKKFQVADEVIKQLRLNSWEREYIKQINLLETNKEIYYQLKSTFFQYFSQNKAAYSQLTKYLLMHIDDKIVSKVDNFVDHEIHRKFRDGWEFAKRLHPLDKI
jgi:hypothetical protein